MESTRNVEKLLERHRAFWRMDTVEKPLVRAGRYSRLNQRGFPLLGGGFAKDAVSVTPEMVEPKVIAEWQDVPRRPVRSGLFSSVAPFGLCWNEAILGCPIRMSVGSVWAAAFLKDWSRLDELRFDPRNPWLLRLLELTRLLVKKAGGRVPVTQTLLRGPIDMAAAALGYQRLCVELYRSPREVERLLGICTEIFLETAKAHLSLLPPFREGFISAFGIWAPGRTVLSQTDNSVLLSPSVYAKHVQPYDERIIDAFEYPIVHTHQPCMQQIIQPLLELQGLRALQMSLDRPNGPPVSEMIPMMRRVQERKPLIITGAATREELNLMLEALDPRGLCLSLSLWTEEERAKTLVP
ncbi:MAG: uroporphyrinogen decarboxylase family protein [Candidatus Bathyarchaeia archaeon]